MCLDSHNTSVCNLHIGFVSDIRVLKVRSRAYNSKYFPKKNRIRCSEMSYQFNLRRMMTFTLKIPNSSDGTCWEWDIGDHAGITLHPGRMPQSHTPAQGLLEGADMAGRRRRWHREMPTAFNGRMRGAWASEGTEQNCTQLAGSIRVEARGRGHTAGEEGT